MGVCAFAAAWALAVAMPAPAKAGGFGESFAGGLVGGTVGGFIGGRLANPPPPRVEYRYRPAPVYQPAPVYAAPNWCSLTTDAYGNYCNVYACAKVCNGGQSGYNSFSRQNCDYQPYGGPRRRCTF